MKNVYRYVLIIDIRIYIHVKCTYVLLVDIYIYIEICCTVSMYAYCYNWYVVDRRGNVTAPFSQTSLRNRPSLPNMKRWCCQPWNHGTVPTAWVVTAGDIKFQMWPFFTCRSVHTFVTNSGNGNLGFGASGNWFRFQFPLGHDDVAGWNDCAITMNTTWRPPTPNMVTATESWALKNQFRRTKTWVKQVIEGQLAGDWATLLKNTIVQMDIFPK